MTQPTRSQVHIDRAMTRVSIAYRNAGYIAEQVFPVVPVQHQSDKYFVFDKSSWFRNEAGLRSPGTRGPFAEYSITADTYACKPISESMLVPDEIVDNADSPLQPRRDATEFTTDKVMLYAEKEVADLVFGAGWSSSATPTTTWDDDSSDPINDVEVGKETVVGLLGREPNVMVMGRNVWTDLKNHPDLLDRIKFTSTGVMTEQLLAQIFGVPKILIGNAIYTTAVEGLGVTTSYSFIWGKHAWLGWVPPTPGLMQPAAGYMFTWKNRVVYRFRREEELSDVMRTEWHYNAKATCADAGYLFKSCVA